MSIAISGYSKAEEIANSVTHVMRIILSIAGLLVMTALASVFGTVWHIVGCSIYGATQILLYTASTLDHSITLPRAKVVLRGIRPFRYLPSYRGQLYPLHACQTFSFDSWLLIFLLRRRGLFRKIRR